jgi:hypothetical protein
MSTLDIDRARARAAPLEARSDFATCLKSHQLLVGVGT